MGFALKKITTEGWVITGVLAIVQLIFAATFVASYVWAYGSLSCDSPFKDVMLSTVPSAGWCCNNDDDPSSTDECVSWEDYKDSKFSSGFLNCISYGTVSCTQDDYDDDLDKQAGLFETYYALSSVCMAIVAVIVALIAAAYFLSNLRSLIQIAIIPAQLLFFILAASALAQPGQDNSALTCNDVTSACSGVFVSTGASTACGGVAIVFAFIIAVLLFIVPIKFKWCCCCMCFDWDFRDVQDEGEEVVDRPSDKN